MIVSGTAAAAAASRPPNPVGHALALRQLTSGPDGIAVLARLSGSSSLVELRYARVAQTDPARWQTIDEAAKVYALIDHPRFRKLIGRDAAGEIPVLMFDALVELTLDFHLSQGPLPVAEAWLLFQRVAHALDVAHRLGFVHGRIGPSRIYVRDDGSPVLDFAWLDVGTKHSPLDLACRPPELGMSALSPRSDVYALGMLMRIALLGREPRPGETYAIGSLDFLLEQLTRPEPEDRPGMSEVCEAIDAALKKNPRGAPPREESLPPELMQTQISHAPAANEVRVSVPGTRGLHVGSTLGRFEILNKVAEGGMGEVYRAIDRATGAIAALKVLRPHAAKDEAGLRRFRKEARILSEIRSPHIANLIEVNRDGEVDFIALEFVDGKDLDDLLDLRGGRLQEPDALSIVADVARGLAEAHERGIVHRDIKPQNVMIAGNSEAYTGPNRAIVKLCDFGIARALDRHEGTLAFTEADALIGTPAYMAPEQCSGQLLSPATDIYALGVTLFLLISGRLPFEADDPTALLVAHTAKAPPDLADVCDVSQATASLVARMLSKAPQDRFVDAAHLLQAIERILRGDPTHVEVHPILPATPPGRIVRHVYEWELKASAEALWPFISNTDRLNRAVGLPPATFARAPTAEGITTTGRNRIAGVSLRWLEHPFEWIEGRRWSVLRLFTGGVMHWFTIQLELHAKPAGGTLLRYTMTLHPRHWLGRLIVALEMRWKQRPALARAFERIDGYAADQGATAPGEDAFEEPAQLAEPARIALEQALEKLRADGVGQDLRDALGAFCAHAPDQEIAHLRPLAFANAHGLNEDKLVDACLRAAHHGLLVLLWQVLCPLCRIPSDFAESLSALQSHGHCPSCNLNFQIDFAQALELVFRVSPRVRTSELRTYCLGGPAFAPHVVAQLRLAPHERVTIDLALGAGSYKLRSPQLPHQFPLHVSHAAHARRGSVEFRADAPTQGERVLVAPGVQSIEVDNALDREIVVRLERTALREDALTAARATCLASFRLLFPGEVLKAGRLVAVGHTAFVMAQVHDQRRLIAQLGDARAFERVMEYWTWVSEIVAAEGGAVVKTASGVTMCAFDSAASATRAAIGLRSRCDSLESVKASRHALDLRLAVHQGSAVAATLDGRLDYFGVTVEAALELVMHAPPGQILLSWEVADDQDVVVDVTRAGCVLELSSLDSSGDFGVVVAFATQASHAAD